MLTVREHLVFYAKLKGVAAEEVARVTTANARALFPKAFA
jgi:Tat protein secretion system quality control protein TatD with DNase activity